MAVAVSKLSQVFPQLVHHVGAEDESHLAAALELRREEKGTRLLAYGEPADSLLLVSEGELAISLPSDKGVVNLGRRGAGMWVGELGMIEPGPASATVEAASDVTLWVLTHEAFGALRETSPRAAARLLEVFCRDIADRLRTCNSVLFRRGEEGALTLVPAHEAKEHGLARLLHEIRDLLHGPAAPPPSPGPVPPPPSEGLSLDAFVDRHLAFGCLTEEDRHHLVQACEEKTFPDGHVFIREGQTRDDVYLLLEGQAEVIVMKPHSATFAVDRFMGPGEILGLVAILDRGPRSATCRARGPLKVAALPVEAANLLMHTRAPISCAFQHALAAQLVHDARRLNEELVLAAGSAS